MVKSDQEAEQKNIITLLQRQNMSLEGKCEKLQSHTKTLELRLKDLLGIIDAKDKTISEKEHDKNVSDFKYKKKIEELHVKIAELVTEKERLRHKIIRAHLKAQGDNDNSIEGMLKRLSKVDFYPIGRI
jgi:hypothetical protein